MKSLLVALIFAGLALQVPALADETQVSKTIEATKLRALSDRYYLTIIADSAAAGRHYSPADVASGLSRNYTEWKSRYQAAGYTILTETAGF
jgi:hypothetical protein